MTVAMIVSAMGVSFFLIPSGLIVGSITGLSLVIAELFPVLSVGTYMFVINLILLVLSFVLIGNEFGAKTVYTALILGPFVDIVSALVPMEHSMFAQQVGDVLVTNPWFDLLCFVLVLSAAQSILFSINASTGGLDILAKIFNKYFHIPLGTAVTVAGGLICCTAFLINPVGLVVMGLIGTWLNGMILNYFMTKMSSRTRVYIISEQWGYLRDYIINEISRGVTLHEAKGGFSGEPKTQIECILTHNEFAKLLDHIKENDIQTFITSDPVSEVYGQWRSRSIRHVNWKPIKPVEGTPDKQTF